MGQNGKGQGGVMKLYLFNLLIGIDQFANVLLGGAPDRTLSYRCWQHRDHWAGRMAVKFVDTLFRPWGSNHCQSVYEGGDSQTKEVWG